MFFVSLMRKRETNRLINTKRMCPLEKRDEEGHLNPKRRQTVRESERERASDTRQALATGHKRPGECC